MLLSTIRAGTKTNELVRKRLTIHHTEFEEGRYSPALDAPGIGKSRWGFIFPESGDFAGDVGGLYVHSPVFLQAVVPSGRYVWANEQN